MDDRIRRWDEKFARGEELHEFAPSPPLPAAAEGIAPGLALDLACGAGRHALWLAGRGWRVQAMDGSRTGIERMLAEARARGVAERIEARIADLEAPDFALEGAYDLVCDFYFLHRPLFGQIRRAVRPGGRLLAAAWRAARAGRILGLGDPALPRGRSSRERSPPRHRRTHRPPSPA